MAILKLKADQVERYLRARDSDAQTEAATGWSAIGRFAEYVCRCILEDAGVVGEPEKVTVCFAGGASNIYELHYSAKLKPTIPVMRDGYIQWLEPMFTVPGERYRMFGDHGNFTPVVFR